MVGLVLVSHSRALADGLRELLLQVAREGAIAAAGGMEDGGLGTSAERVRAAIREVDNPDGVVVMVDLGSAVMTAEAVIEGLADSLRGPVILSGGPFVEGALAAAVQASLGDPITAVVAASTESARIPKLGA